MSNINYDQLRGGETAGDPPDGQHDAALVRASIVDTRSGGSALVTEWQVSRPTPYYWTTWFGFEANRLSVTQDFLDALGIDRSGITDDEKFEAALSQVTGTVYRVRTEAWSGGVNTYPEKGVTPGQTSLADVPIASGDLPEPQPVASNTSDDDIPF